MVFWFVVKLLCCAEEGDLPRHMLQVNTVLDQRPSSVC